MNDQLEPVDEFESSSLMSIRREDYILRMIEELGHCIGQAVAMRDKGRLSEALMMVVATQEKLFARPAAVFAPLGIDEQLRLLALDESPETARSKYLAYAALLKEAGRVYQARSQEDMAAGAFQLALYVALTTAEEDRARAGELQPLIADLKSRLRDDQINPPVRELLARIG